MKKFILAIVFMFIAPMTVFGAWTITPTQPTQADQYVYFSFVCTSDGNSLTATNLLSSDYIGYPSQVQGTTLMWVYVSPGTGGVAPDTTINVTLTNEWGASLWAGTGISNTAGSWHMAWEDIGSYPPILSQLNLALNDIGTAGDQVTIYFICWLSK